MMIEVIGVRTLGGYNLEIEFCDATIGVRDFSFICDKTRTMAEPLKDASYFASVFIEDGAPTWPNGYDWDAIALHDEMKKGWLATSRRCSGIADATCLPENRQACI